MSRTCTCTITRTSHEDEDVSRGRGRLVEDAHAHDDPFALAVRGDPGLAHAKVIHDPFHLVKRAGEAVDAVRREVFFRAGKEQRGVGRGARCLFLRASQKLRSDERLRLGRLLAMNRRLAHAYQVKEQLRYVVSKSVGRTSIEVGLDRLLRRTQRRDNVPMRKLHDSLRAHREAILDLGEHRPPTGRIEALNNNWETTIRRGRGYRNLDHLMLKLRFAIVNPIRTDDGTRRFLALGPHAPREPRVAGIH